MRPRRASSLGEIVGVRLGHEHVDLAVERAQLLGGRAAAYHRVELERFSFDKYEARVGPRVGVVRPRGRVVRHGKRVAARLRLFRGWGRVASSAGGATRRSVRGLPCIRVVLEGVEIQPGLGERRVWRRREWRRPRRALRRLRRRRARRLRRRVWRFVADLRVGAGVVEAVLGVVEVVYGAVVSRPSGGDLFVQRRGGLQVRPQRRQQGRHRAPVETSHGLKRY
mmetsp:Transcript_13098/g.46395  ORF Transcript_13098/g.46395 Transcript_13098/m.46395 type:complete len:224 (+) Transcript_13098:834-1505(+)